MRFAADSHLLHVFRVLDGTHEVRHLTRVVRDDAADHDCRDSATDESLPRLLRRQLDQRSFAEEEAKQVRHDVVRHDHRDGNHEPDQSFKHVLDNEIGLRHDDQQRHVCPRELSSRRTS